MSEPVAEILSRHEGKREELIPILQQAQESLGYLPKEAMQEIAKFLKLPASTVYGVSSFYGQFKFNPRGKHMIRVCRGTACHVRGSARILEELEKHLAIKDGETTSDLEYTLETVACIGACALAPTMVIDKETHGQMSPQKARQLLQEIRVGIPGKAIFGAEVETWTMKYADTYRSRMGVMIQELQGILRSEAK